jgi:hypothetical protein
MSKFSTDKINHLLEVDSNGYLIRRESTHLEVKQGFKWNNKRLRIKYLKTMASFANNGGGYILFGIQDAPREIVGIKDDFEIDEDYITTSILQYFSDNIHFERHLYELDQNDIGMIYVHESSSKPVICTKDYDDILSHSTTYYRYRGKSTEIKHGELKKLTQEIRDQERDKWIRIFEKVATIGVENVGLLDTQKGTIETKGQKFLLDESLLESFNNQINVVDEYESVEKGGAPAFTIIGEIQGTGRVIRRTTAIRDEHLIKAFLKNEDVTDPQNYLENICYLSSYYFPAYYFIKQTGLKLDDAVDRIKNINKDSHTKTKLIERLEDDGTLKLKWKSCKLDANSDAGEKRRKYFDSIDNQKDFDIDTKIDAKRFLECVLNLDFEDYNKEKLKGKILNVFEKYYTSDLSTLIRYTISYIDLIENRDKVT